jgi:hypothetical protein
LSPSSWSPEFQIPEPFWRLFREGLRDLGYIEGQNVLFEYRSAEGKPSLLPQLAADLVRLNVSIIVTWHLLDGIAAFAHVVDSGSSSAAARRLNISKSAISAHVQA